jgi:hypothetical protein
VSEGTGRRVAPPSGVAPPLEVAGPDGPIDLLALARVVCGRYRDEGHAWCVHDNQHLLNWAVLDVHAGVVDLLEQVAWLARVLEARDFPLERLVRNLEIDAEVVRERLADEALAGRLAEAARFVAGRGSFLD